MRKLVSCVLIALALVGGLVALCFSRRMGLDPCTEFVVVSKLKAILVRSGIASDPHRFRTKRQLWAYSGLAIETRGSGQYRYVEGQLRRSQKPVSLRSLNKNRNHDLKWIFKSACG
jgi:hypothetical protein